MLSSRQAQGGQYLAFMPGPRKSHLMDPNDAEPGATTVRSPGVQAGLFCNFSRFCRAPSGASTFSDCNAALSHRHLEPLAAT